MEIMQWFLNGGQFMYIILLSDLFAFGVILAAASSCRKGGNRVFMQLTFLLVLFPLFNGLLGHYLGYVSAMSAISMVDPASRQEMYTMSMSFAKIPSSFGAGSAFVLFLIWFVGSKRCKNK